MVVVSVAATYAVNDNCSTGLMTLIRDTSVTRARVPLFFFFLIDASFFSNGIVLLTYILCKIYSVKRLRTLS